MTNWIGKVIGKVRIDKLVARGGMAEVYLGTHTTLDRPVAIKVLLSHLEDEPDIKERFQREARVLAGLRHPNLVQIYDYDLIEGQPFITMEYIAGPALNTYLREIHQQSGRLTHLQVGRLMVMLASALDYAHAQGVIHRDVKPANILLHVRNAESNAALPTIEEAEPILTDFGLLRLTDSSSKSTTGTVAGTPAYMSPEQARGEHVDNRSDIYSLGIVLYELLAGGVPFDADTTMGILMKHIQEPPPPIPGLPYELELVLEKVLAKRASNRYATAREFAKAFLDAAQLNLEDVAPGYSIAPRSNVSPAVPATLPPPSRPEILSTPSSSVKPWQVAIPILAFLALGVFVALRLLTPTASPKGVAPPEATSAGNANTVQDDTVFGLVRFHDVTNQLDEATLSVQALPPASEGTQYEAWLVNDEERRSMGILTLNAAGEGQLSFIDTQGRNLLARYDHFEITLEPDPDSSPGSSGQVIFSSGLPQEALDHIKHLLVSYGSTPHNTPYVYGLMNTAELINTESQSMLTALNAQDPVAVKKTAEGIYNLIVGSQGDQYGDLDGDGQPYDPGDGYGLLLNGDNSGYIEGSFSHAQYSAQTPEASSNIQAHALHVMESARNLEGWTVELRDLVLMILADPTSAEAAQQIRQAAALADRLLNGRDLNGNERVEPISGEGGARTILEHAQYLVDMPILSGAKRIPPAAPPMGDMPDIHSGDGTAEPDAYK